MEAVRAVLQRLHMEVYSAAFAETGYDDLEFLLTLDETGLGGVAP